jgi:hypothetical protein
MTETIPNNVIEALEQILNYLREDEVENYSAVDPEDRAGHIFTALLAVELWLFYGPLEGKFAFGTVVVTPGALDALAVTAESPAKFLRRHIAGDWGELDEADRQENETSLAAGFRLFSVYRTLADQKLWIITEADRSVTTILLPDEY